MVYFDRFGPSYIFLCCFLGVPGYRNGFDVFLGLDWAHSLCKFLIIPIIALLGFLTGQALIINKCWLDTNPLRKVTFLPKLIFMKFTFLRICPSVTILAVDYLPFKKTPINLYCSCYFFVNTILAVDYLPFKKTPINLYCSCYFFVNTLLKSFCSCWKFIFQN